MAEKLSSYEFTKSSTGYTYPWDEWLDGSVWRLTRSEDFPNARATSMRVRFHHMARARDMKVHTKFEEAEVLVVQAYKP